jgi:hypothetical protein
VLKFDPFLPVALLQTGQSPISKFYEQEGYKAATGDLTQSDKFADLIPFRKVTI